MEEFENYSESLLSEFNEKRAYNELKGGIPRNGHSAVFIVGLPLYSAE